MKGGVTILAEINFFLISILQLPELPMGNRAKAIDFPIVGEKLPEVTSPSPSAVITF